MADTYNPGQEGLANTASPNLQSEKARFDPVGSANKLMTALGTPGVQAGLADFNAAYQQKKLQDQAMKVDAYTQQFMDDHGGGAVSQAQVKERFPETVPVIAARIAESVGKKQGALDFAKIVDQVNNDDSLRLDTEKRNAFIADARQKMFSAIPQGNEFYSSGVVAAMDQQISQQEGKWQAQTAQYHEQVQKTALSDETVSALNSNDPKAALADIDERWGKSSSLNNVERNKVYVDTVIKHAAVSDDVNVLDKIPQRYLNADSKAAIYQARIAITGQQFAQFSRAKEFEAYQRTEQDRKDKVNILRTLSDGGSVDPAQYIRSPEIHAFAVESMSTPTIPEASSKAAVQAFKASIYGSGMVGSVGSTQDITKQILSLRGKMNPKDMADLVDEVPKIVEGHVLMNDPQVRRAYTDNLSVRMDDLSRSPMASIQRLMGTGNLRGNAMAMFEGEIQSGYTAHYEANQHNWPGAFDAKKIVDAAVSKTSAYVDKMTSIEGLRVHQPDEPPKSPPISNNKAATSPSSGLPKGVKLIQ